MAHEYRLHCAVADFLRAAVPKDILWSHLPMGERRDARTGGKLKRMGTAPGWPDFIFLLPEGRTLFLELKGDGGRLSRRQRDFHTGANRLGHRCLIARSVDDVQEALVTAGVQLRARVA